MAAVEEHEGQAIVRHLTGDTAARSASDDAMLAALGAIGAFSDLDWDEMQESLDRIRHESSPTPPIRNL